MNNVLAYLSKNEYENAYIIRGIVNKISDFRYEIEYNDANEILGLIAFWEDDHAVTLRGNKEFYEKWFSLLVKKYDFYDLDETFINIGIGDCSSYYLTMVYEHKKTYGHNASYEYIEYKKIDKNEWNRISNMYKDIYNKEFTSFYEQNMEWLCVYYKGNAIANLCLEKVYGNLLIISNLYVIPNMRRQGIGRRLLASIIQDYVDYRFMLFVSNENIGAITLYEKLGFNIHGQVANIDGHRSML